jgi:hypothetical protein
MKNPCGWCVHTSSQIDSLEYYVESLKEQNKSLKQRLAQYEQPVSRVDIYNEVQEME